MAKQHQEDTSSSPTTTTRAMVRSSTLEDFVDIAEGSRHSLGLTSDGVLMSWGKATKLGQLGRDTTSNKTSTGTDGKYTATPGSRPGTVPLPTEIQRVSEIYASVGSPSDSGHSAIIDQDGNLWMSGCDRWQQLGLGSSNGGAAGYTWHKGKIWHERFTISRFVTDLMKQTESSPNDSDNRASMQGQSSVSKKPQIRDVALGGDHTVILSTNRNVYAFGKGGDGQLGLNAGKPFVSAPIKSPILSHRDASAVCAVDACSIVLIGQDGKQHKKTGRCRSQAVLDGLARCIKSKREKGLITDEGQKI